MSLLSSNLGGVRFHADEDADHNMLQGKFLDIDVNRRAISIDRWIFGRVSDCHVV